MGHATPPWEGLVEIEQTPDRDALNPLDPFAVVARALRILADA